MGVLLKVLYKLLLIVLVLIAVGFLWSVLIALQFGAGSVDTMFEGSEYYPKMICYFEPYGFLGISAVEADGSQLSLTIVNLLNRDVEIEIYDKMVEDFNIVDLESTFIPKGGETKLTIEIGKPVDPEQHFFPIVVFTSDTPFFYNFLGIPIYYLELRCSNYYYGQILK